jgi:hypothetical protein
VRTAVGLVILAAILVVVVALLWRRRTRDEIHSIDHYRDALGTLQEMRSDAASSSVRVLSSDEARELRQPEPRQVIRSSDRRYPSQAVALPSGASEGKVLDDSSQTGHSPFEHEHHRGHDSSEWAISRAQSRPPLENRQWVAMGVATAIVLVLLIVGVLIGRTSHGGTKAETTTTIEPKKKTASTTTPKTTPTTTPASYLPQPGGTNSSANYLAPSSRYVLVVTATGGGCWTVANAEPSGSQLFVGTVTAAAPQQITVTGGAQISLGAPGSATVTLDGRPVVFPSNYGAPLVLNFQPPAPPTTTTTTAPPTTTTAAPTTTTTLRTP